MHTLTCPNTEEPEHSLSFFLLVCFLQIGLEYKQDDQAEIHVNLIFKNSELEDFVTQFSQKPWGEK